MKSLLGNGELASLAYGSLKELHKIEELLQSAALIRALILLIRGFKSGLKQGSNLRSHVNLGFVFGRFCKKQPKMTTEVMSTPTSVKWLIHPWVKDQHRLLGVATQVYQLHVAQQDSSPGVALGQMNEPPGARMRVGLSALTIAEYFREELQQDHSQPAYSAV
jgi:hypothetical protein